MFVLFLVFRSTEPTYQGKTLSECLVAQDASLPGYSEKLDKEAEAAIRQMGAKAVPHLVAMLRAEDTAWRAWRIYLCQKLDWLYLKVPPDTAHLHWQGWVGLGILGPEAKAAIPDLLMLLTDPDEEFRERAIGLLDDVGLEHVEMIPILRRALADDSERVVYEALHILIKRGAAARSAVPGIITLLSHPDHNVRREAMMALLTISTQEPEKLVELLKNQFDDSHGMVRGNAMVQFAQREPDADVRRKETSRFLTDPDASVRFKATNLVNNVSIQWSTNAVECAFNDTIVEDLLYVWQRNCGGKFQLAPGLQMNTWICLDTFGPMPKEEGFRLLEAVLKEQAGFDFKMLTNGVTLVTQGVIPSPPKKKP